MNKGKRKETPKSTDTASVTTYMKSHASYSLFKSRDFLEVLNCDGPEEARIEAEQQLNNMLSFPNINATTRSFIGSLITNNLQVLFNDDAAMYWKERENIKKLRLNAHDQLNLYNSIVAETLEKARSDNNPSYSNDINNDESVPARLNQYWLELLEQSKNDESLHRYSGLKNNIIIIGEGIKKNDNMDQIMYNHLLDRLSIGQVKGFSIHDSLQSYFSSILNTDDIDSLELAARLLPALNICLTQVKKEAFLIQEISLAVVSFLKNIALVREEEKSYRAFFVHYVCTAISNYLGSPIIFLPAEASLISMSKYLKYENRIKNDRECYKADGIYQYKNFEICINEISGPYNNSLRSKFQLDFHKAMYGCMSIMWDIIQNYHYGTIKTFEELEIHFLHNKVKSMQLWSLKHDDGMFVMHRKRKATISDSIDDKSQTIHQLIYLCHTSKVKFEQTILSINKLKKEHNTFMNGVLSGRKQKSDRVDLRDVIKMTIFKLSEAHDSAGLFDTDPISFGDFDEDTLSFLETL